jgi:hypothetical protein
VEALVAEPARQVDAVLAGDPGHECGFHVRQRRGVDIVTKGRDAR